jgi:hypothetical protein
MPPYSYLPDAGMKINGKKMETEKVARIFLPVIFLPFHPALRGLPARRMDHAFGGGARRGWK